MSARVLRPGGRIGISDIVRTDRGDRSDAVDCGAGAITVADYRAALCGAGLIDVSIALTDAIGGGLHNAIVRASKPT